MMTAEQLKNSILQLAMQGKLVEQRAEEGTGAKLLTEIIENKTDDNRDASFDDEPPFVIPESWTWVKHNFLFRISGGSQPSKSNFSSVMKDGFVRLYQIRDYGEKPVPIYVDRSLVSKFTRKGDILLARYGGSLGKVFWAEDGAYNVAMAKVIPLFDESLISKRFVFLYYHSSLYQDIVLNSSRSAQAGFNRDDLGGMWFPLPPIAEQKRIVAKIEELMPFVEQYATASTKLNTLNTTFPEMMKKSILQEAVQGKLVSQDPNDEPASVLLEKIAEKKKRLIKEGKIKKQKPLPEITEDEIPFDIPESWEWVKLETICYDLRYGTSSKSTKEGKMIVLRMGNIQNGEIDYTDLVYSAIEADNEKYKLAPLDILFNRTNSRELVGKTGIYRGDHPAIFAGYLIQIRPILMDPEYLNYVMNSEYERNYCKDVKSDGINQSNVNAKKIGNFIVPVPPLKEQKRIVQKLRKILPVIEF